jgi:hypothetical protein
MVNISSCSCFVAGDESSNGRARMVEQEKKGGGE